MNRNGGAGEDRKICTQYRDGVFVGCCCFLKFYLRERVQKKAQVGVKCKSSEELDKGTQKTCRSRGL